jgi:hypothetical protein
MNGLSYKIPFLITILSVLGGVSIAIVFGVNEDFIKHKIAIGLENNPEIQAMQNFDEKALKLKDEADKNWRYYQRYHFHSNGIAAMTLGLLLLLTSLKLSKIEYFAASYAISVGGFLYPFVWLFAGIYGPIMGRSNAKEAFAIFGYMGGIYLVGVLYVFYLALTKNWRFDFFNLKESK